MNTTTIRFPWRSEDATLYTQAWEDRQPIEHAGHPHFVLTRQLEASGGETTMVFEIVALSGEAVDASEYFSTFRSLASILNCTPAEVQHEVSKLLTHYQWRERVSASEMCDAIAAKCKGPAPYGEDDLRLDLACALDEIERLNLTVRDPSVDPWVSMTRAKLSGQPWYPQALPVVPEGESIADRQVGRRRPPVAVVSGPYDISPSTDAMLTAYFDEARNALDLITYPCGTHWDIVCGDLGLAARSSLAEVSGAIEALCRARDDAAADGRAAQNDWTQVCRALLLSDDCNPAQIVKRINFLSRAPSRACGPSAGRTLDQAFALLQGAELDAIGDRFNPPMTRHKHWSPSTSRDRSLLTLETDCLYRPRLLARYNALGSVDVDELLTKYAKAQERASDETR